MKNTLLSLIMGLALLTGARSALAQVTNLGIAPAPGGQSLLYWPVSSTNYVLQTTTNLAAPNWVTASDAVPVNAATVTNAAPAGYFRLLAIPAGMALIPAGWFTMGDTLDGIVGSEPTNIYVSAFVMDVNLVSYSQWTNVYAYATNRGYNFVNRGARKNSPPNQPVQTVNWYDCVKWSNARSQQAGLVPVYYTDAGLTQVYTNGEPTTVYQNMAVNGYRLPTEAEWEKAARGGLSGQRFPWGNYIGGSHANYYGSIAGYSYDMGPSGYNPLGGTTGPYTTPVGTFPANGYGLYDMAGNLFEWCWDWYGKYGQPTTNNPTGPAGPLILRVLRGGSWSGGSIGARCAFRLTKYPDYAYYDIGFRCVRGL